MPLNNFNWNVSSPGIEAAMIGFQNAGRGLEQFFGQKRQKQEYEEEQAKQRAQETTRLVTSLDTMGVLPKDVGTTKSLDELRGIRDGIVEHANIGEHVAKQQEAELRQQEIMQRMAAALQEQQSSHALQGVIAGGATPGAPELSTPGVFGGPVAGEMQPGFDQGKLLAALGQNPQAATPKNLEALSTLLRGMDATSGNNNPLAQFNAQTSRMNAESNRKIAENRGQPGPEKPTVNYTVKSPDGTTLTERLTKTELADRQKQQNAPQIAALQSEREQHQQALDKGDNRFGWTLGSRRERIVAIDKALAEMGASKADTTQPGGNAKDPLGLGLFK